MKKQSKNKNTSLDGFFEHCEQSDFVFSKKYNLKKLAGVIDSHNNNSFIYLLISINPQNINNIEKNLILLLEAGHDTNLINSFKNKAISLFFNSLCNISTSGRFERLFRYNKNNLYNIMKILLKHDNDIDFIDDTKSNFIDYFLRGLNDVRFASKETISSREEIYKEGLKIIISKNPKITKNNVKVALLAEDREIWEMIEPAIAQKYLDKYPNKEKLYSALLKMEPANVIKSYLENKLISIKIGKNSGIGANKPTKHKI